MEQPSETKKTEQAVALLLLFLIIILGLIWAPYIGIKPQLETLKEKNLDVAVKGTDLRAKEEQVENLKELEPKIKAAQSTVKKLAIALPEGEEIPEILVQVESMASSSGLSITSFSPSKEQLMEIATEETEEEGVAVMEGATEGAMMRATEPAEPTVSAYDFSMTVEGPYSAVVKFLNTLETNLRPIKITQTDLTGEPGGNPKVSASFDMQAYYQK